MSGPYESTRDIIVGMPAFRRLAGKTQVLVTPADGAVRTRLTHTLEVVTMARRIARALGLDEALAEAIALAHDIGHPAFGHAGERALARLGPSGFHHAVHGVRVLTELAPLARLPEAVIDGVLKHSKGRSGPAFARGPALSRTTMEARVVRAADLYAYAWHDLEDALALGLVDAHDLPDDARRVLGVDPAVVKEMLVASTIASSTLASIELPEVVARALEALRDHLYEHLYESPLLAAQTERAKACLGRLFEAYTTWEAASLHLTRRVASPALSIEARAIDFLASLTDAEALSLDQALAKRAALSNPSHAPCYPG